MKKYLSLLCVLSALSFLPACGEKNSEKTESKIEYIKYETDDLAFEMPSDWKLDKNTSNSSDSFWFEKSEESFLVRLYSDDYTRKYCKKLRTDEAKEEWEDLKNIVKEDDPEYYESTYKFCEITDDFVKNGQAYIIVTNTQSNTQSVHFYAQGVTGSIEYIDGEEMKTVEKLIDSIIFYSTPESSD